MVVLGVYDSSRENLYLLVKKDTMSRDTPIEVLFLNTLSNDIVFTHDIELFHWFRSALY